jgi:glycyl-tRNA synthetase alpha chain
MEVTQFTYFQQVGGIECNPIAGELTYGLERLAMYIQGVENVYDLGWNFVPANSQQPTANSVSNTSGELSAVGSQLSAHFTYGDVFKQNEIEFSAYNLEAADTEQLFEQFKQAEKECLALLAYSNVRSGALTLPAYDQCIKASHRFNLLDARGVIGVTERASYIGRVRALAKACCEAWVASQSSEFRVQSSGKEAS